MSARAEADDLGHVRGESLDAGGLDGALLHGELMLAGRAANGGHRVPAVLADPVQDERAVELAALTIEMRVAASTKAETQESKDYVHATIPAPPADRAGRAAPPVRNSLARPNSAHFLGSGPRDANKVAAGGA
jgi:hypothetical protein